MTDLFGVDGNVLLDNVTMPAPYKARIASLRRFIEGFDAEIDQFTGLAQRRLTHDAGYTAIQQIPGIGPVLAVWPMEPLPRPVLAWDAATMQAPEGTPRSRLFVRPPPRLVFDTPQPPTAA